ncbi:hypothetical protein [Streptacidiphilus sp. EB129]|uniref:hypothetical protein n=1 Tax=Streptacidiphilus sp. EB129 TaxID=3156262 RepID=UPI0035161E10
MNAPDLTTEQIVQPLTAAEERELATLKRTAERGAITPTTYPRFLQLLRRRSAGSAGQPAGEPR